MDSSVAAGAVFPAVPVVVAGLAGAGVLVVVEAPGVVAGAAYVMPLIIKAPATMATAAVPVRAIDLKFIGAPLGYTSPLGARDQTRRTDFATISQALEELDHTCHSRITPLARSDWNAEQFFVGKMHVINGLDVTRNPSPAAQAEPSAVYHHTKVLLGKNQEEVFIAEGLPIKVRAHRQPSFL